MIANPFMDAIDLDVLEEEIKIRKARENLLDYELYVHLNYRPSKFHTFLCAEIQKFLETDTGHALDVLLLSVP